MSYITIEEDLTDALHLLDGLDVNQNKIRASVLSQVGTKAKGAAKRGYKGVLNKRSGYLYKSIRKYMYRNKKAVVVTAHSPEDPVRYGFVLAKGTTIEAKNYDYLTFQIDGKWVKKKSITITPRNFIEEPVEKYLRSPALDEDIDKILQKKIDQIESKRRISNNDK